MPADLARRIKTHRGEVLDLLTKPTPADVPRECDYDLLADVLDVFPEAEVVRTTAKPTRSGATPPEVGDDMSDVNPYRITATANPQHQRVLDLLADVFDRDPRKALDLNDAWHERIAITTLDGHLTIGQAEAIAWKEISQAAARNK